MGSFVDLIRKIGIFMIAAQAVIHFAPGQKYEKYLKLVVSIMILLQFMAPVYEILAKTAADWETEFHALEEEFSGSMEESAFADTGTEPVTETLIKSMEQEIKSRLNSAVSEEGYLVENVRVTIHEAETAGETLSKEYAVDQVRVVVRRRTVLPTEEAGKERPKQELFKIEVPEVTLTKEAGEEPGGMEAGEGGGEEGGTEEKAKMEVALRAKFCAVLGMEEKYMEVSLYGFAEDDIQ